MNSLEVLSTVRVFGKAEDRLTVIMGISRFSAADQTDPMEFSGIFDTGASKSMVSDRVASRLNLPVTGKRRCGTAAGMVVHNTHLINVALPNGVCVESLPVTSGPLGTIDFLLGMDILNLGDFSITHRDGFKIVEFRMYRSVSAM